ncbi:MAG: hypothetical protein ACYCR5_04560 [Leptospirillum sp.]
MKKTVSFGSIWFHAVLLAMYMRETRGKANLKELYRVCAFLDDEVDNMSLPAFKSAFFRARQRFKGVNLVEPD